MSGASKPRLNREHSDLVPSQRNREAMSRNAQPTIAYVVNTYPGLYTFVADEIDALRAMNVRVVPVSLNTVEQTGLAHERDRNELSATLFIKGVAKGRVVRAIATQFLKRPERAVRALKLAVGFEPWNVKRLVWRLFYLAEACVLAGHVRSQKATHIHAHFGGAPSFVAWFASELLGDVPWSFTVHGPHDFFDEGTNQLKDKVAAAAFTVAISDYCRSQLLRIADSQEAAKRVVVVRCGIELDRFPFRIKPVGDPFRIITVARLAPEKGQFVLLDAVAELHGLGHRVAVDLVGTGPAHDELEQRARALGLESVVTFHGSKTPDEVAELLNAADAFCLPSFAEGLPVSIMEAMATGIPVIATAINGTPELVENGRTGRLVIAGRSSDIVDAVQAIVADPEGTRAMLLAARSEVAAQHEISATAVVLATQFGSAATALSPSTASRM
jgi:glycosyltransferase involved in cell wall biosynthesis